jgi:hypothetical protein
MEEKIDRQVIIKVQPSLFERFEKKCKEDYKTVSEVIRHLMLKYIKEDDDKV